MMSTEHEGMAMENSNYHLRRRVEEIDYWRKRAGWYDDDVSMKEFNNGVYDTYYQIDDDEVARKGTKGGGGGRGPSRKGIATFLKVAAVLVALAIFVLLYRAIARRFSSSKGKNKKNSSNKSSKSRSDSKSRSGRNSSSRSRAGRSSSSRSRSGRSRSRKSSSSNYDLMDDKTDAQSRKSSRSRSRSRRSRSRAGSRSRSKSKSRLADKEVVLV